MKWPLLVIGWTTVAGLAQAQAGAAPPPVPSQVALPQLPGGGLQPVDDDLPPLPALPALPDLPPDLEKAAAATPVAALQQVTAAPPARKAFVQSAEKPIANPVSHPGSSGRTGAVVPHAMTQAAPPAPHRAPQGEQPAALVQRAQKVVTQAVQKQLVQKRASQPVGVPASPPQQLRGSMTQLQRPAAPLGVMAQQLPPSLPSVQQPALPQLALPRVPPSAAVARRGEVPALQPSALQQPALQPTAAAVTALQQLPLQQFTPLQAPMPQPNVVEIAQAQLPLLPSEGAAVAALQQQGVPNMQQQMPIPQPDVILAAQQSTGGALPALPQLAPTSLQQVPMLQPDAGRREVATLQQPQLQQEMQPLPQGQQFPGPAAMPQVPILQPGAPMPPMPGSFANTGGLAQQFPGQPAFPEAGYEGPGAPSGMWGGAPLAALETSSQAAQLQTQYQAQLAQYNQQQQQFAQWAQKFQDYERNLDAQQRLYQSYKQMQERAQQGQGFLAPAQPARAVSALVQTASRATGGTRAEEVEKVLASREAALAKRGKALAAREMSLRAESEKLRKEEIDEKQEQSQLDARAQALDTREKQVAKLQTELVAEQRKIWKVLKSRTMQSSTGGSVAQSSAATAAAPQQIPSQRPAPQAVMPVALAQMARGTTRRSVAASSGEARAAAASGGMSKSDLHLVVAATMPAGGVGRTGDSDNEDSATGPGPVALMDPRGEFGDNDQLEQMFLQKSRQLRRKGDVVEG